MRGGGGGEGNAHSNVHFKNYYYYYFYIYIELAWQNRFEKINNKCKFLSIMKSLIAPQKNLCTRKCA